MKLKKYIFLTIFSLGLISCEKSDIKDIKEGNCFIKSISYFENSPDKTFDVDASGKLITARQLGALDGRVLGTIKYSYNANGKVNTAIYNELLTTTYFYENDLLVRTETKNNLGNITVSQIINQNSSSGQIEKLESNDFRGKITYIFSSDSEGNCTKIEGLNKDSKLLFIKTLSKFENGKNPESIFEGLPFRPFEFILGEIPVMDIPVNFGKMGKLYTESKLIETENLNIENPSELKERFSTKRVYNLNENGFPNSHSAYDITGGKSPSFNGDINYVYSGCQ
jgi:hypothetical protein